jgi:hypothetical protein
MGPLGARMIHPVRLAGQFVWGVLMMDLSFRMERNRKEAAKFSDLAKTASSPFLQGYYWRIAERYLLLEDELRPAGTQGNISK